MGSPQQAPTDLYHARASRISQRQATGDDTRTTRTVERNTGVARIEEVEDVDCFAAKLEFHRLIKGEVPEDRGIHVSHARPVQRVNSQRAIQTSGANTRATGGS